MDRRESESIKYVHLNLNLAFKEKGKERVYVRQTYRLQNTTSFRKMRSIKRFILAHTHKWPDAMSDEQMFCVKGYVNIVPQVPLGETV